MFSTDIVGEIEQAGIEKDLRDETKSDIVKIKQKFQNGKKIFETMIYALEVLIYSILKFIY